MDIYNTTTNETVDITLRNYPTDVMIDITGDDENITYNGDLERYEANSDTIDWWQDWAENEDYALELEEQVIEIIGSEAANEIIDMMRDSDIDIYTSNRISAFESVLSDQKED